ncbi:DUF5610 domain-containing protein [Pseudoalteromonas denitrificans]|uniref:DUF5610 domain-containing protein n=1 Tax=Pseudoalteromonas denitrificans DSM 6059 TaxID=1123010 RepID=A0A1I1U535_9GAMM|nr:DUF5610 domain-containing protein [Pseudoalteromonas denitrificans]SFD63813.1 hypothetical protein SAMN02745724_05050 [Pseudoalteromonas denitrificans DSM 6059]
MKIGSSGFQPAALFNQLFKKSDKTQSQSQLSNPIQFSKNNQIASKVMQDKLSHSLSMPPTAKNETDSLFDFEKVAKNVLGFVKSAVLNAQGKGASDDEIKDILSQARSGIEVGISEAYKELEDAGLMTQNIEQGIAKSSDLMSEGLNKLEESLFQPETSKTNYSQASSYNLSNGAELTIRTQEGDEIRISFNSDYQHENASAYQSNNNGESFAYQDSKSYSASFSFEVNGDLNEEEQEAINALMSDLQKVSDDFFSGSLEEAFEQASQINMDTTQLAAFSMNLQQTESLVSVKEYRSNIPGLGLAKQLAPLNDGLQQAYEKAKPLSIESELSGILQWLNQEREQADKFIQYSQSLFDQFALFDNATTSNKQQNNDVSS